MTQSSVRVLERGSAGWPACLAHLGAAQPKRLHVRGSLSLATACAAPAVAMVGARAPSAAGERFARTLARELAEAGVTVVSGLALGIDIRNQNRSNVERPIRFVSPTAKPVKEVLA